MQQFFSFINLFNSALHVSDDKFAHSQEHFLTVHTVLGTMHRHCCRPMERQFHLNRGTSRQQCRCIVPKAVYTVKDCSWRWANLSPETCRAELKRLINEKVVASCWLFTSLSLSYFCRKTKISLNVIPYMYILIKICLHCIERAVTFLITRAVISPQNGM